MTIANWINAVEAANIEAGDKITLKTESDIEQFDGEATVVAAGEPNNSGWLEIETPGEADVYVVSDSSSESGAVLVQGHVRGTGHIANRQDLADVYGVEKAE